MMVLGTVAALAVGGQGASTKQEVANCAPPTTTGNDAIEADVENPDDGNKEDNAKRIRSAQ